MNHPAPRRAWRTAGTGLLALALTAGLVTWPWNQAEIPEAEAQEETATTDGVADTESEALEEAAASGESVEVLSLRSETRDVVAEPDGTFTATEYTTPVRTMIDGEWADIDPTLEVTESGAISPKAATVQMAFSSGGDEPLVTLSKNGHTFTLDWSGDLPEPVIDGDTAIYAEVLEGVDLWVTALGTGFTHTLVVKTAEAAANPELASIEWPVTLDGAAIETTDAGGLSVVDAETLDEWVSVDSPIMWDSTGVADAIASQPSYAGTDTSDALAVGEVASQVGRQASVGVGSEGSAIVLTPDQELLTGADTVYPVYIDPVYRDEFRSSWTMVASAYPSEEYWKWTGDQGVGSCVGLDSSNCEKKRLFYTVSTSFYEGKTILSATFGATLRHNYYDANTGDNADLYLMKSGISSATNWNNQPSGSEVATADTPAPSGGDCSYSADHAVEWDVKTEVANAASAGTSTLTLGIRNASESDSTKWMRFCNNGHLRVKYNTPPDQPSTASMGSSPGPACQWEIDADSYVNVLPTLYATLTDDDHGAVNEWGVSSPTSEQLRAQFALYTNDGTLIYTSALTSAKASGSKFKLDLSTLSDLPTISSGTTIRWAVRAYDGTSYSAWSHDGDPSTCRFVYDTSRPDAPTITSADFPDTDEGSETVGEVGSLTIATTATDVVSYTVDFMQDDAAVRTIALDTASDSATVDYMPTVLGWHTLNVTALDAAGNSASNTYTFLVRESAAAGTWSLGEAAGADTAADADGTNPGDPGSGVTFGADGPGSAPAADFDGSSDAYISTDVYDIAPTGEGVSIAAWAKVDDLSEDGVIASVEGGVGESGMVLGYRSTSATTGQWVLSMPDMGMGAFTSWEVLGGQVTANNQDEWVHLVGVWDDFTGTMTLYVNGVAAGTADRETTWWGDGTVQIGRASSGGSWDDNFDGAIADVRVYDRVVPAGEALELGWQVATRAGYWQFNTVDADTNASPEYDEGPSAALGGDAHLHYSPSDEDLLLDPTLTTALIGTGHLELDGAGDYASVASPVVDTSASFSLTARVRLSTASPDASMTVLSIAGSNASAIEVAYEPDCGDDSGCWVLRLTTADSTAATVVEVESSIDPTAETQGQTIAVTYDSITGQAVLYIDGYASAAMTDPFLSAWAATGDLQIGRGYTAGAGSAYFSGAIDDLRAYSGVLHASVVARLSLKTSDEQPGI